MTEQEIEAVAGGNHGEWFAVLGPHPASAKPENGKQDQGRNGWEIRAFQPQAESVAVLLNGAKLPMERIHKDGLFAVRVPAQPERYRFEITGYDGSVTDIEDTYRFSPVMGDLDLHLHSEGSNHEGFHSFGSHLTSVDGVAGTSFAVWAPNAIVVS